MTPIERLCLVIVAIVAALALWPAMRVEWMLWCSRRSWPHPSSSYPPRSRWEPSKPGPRE